MEAPGQARKATQGILALAGDFLRWLLPILLTTAAVAAGGYYFIHARLDEEIRRHVEAKLQAQYAHLRVSVRAARRAHGVGIEIRGLSLRDPRPGGTSDRLAEVDEMLVRCSTDIPDLLAGRAMVRQILLRGLRLHAARRADGTWNLQSLLPLPRFGDSSPPLVLEQAAVEVAEKGGSAAGALMLRDIYLTVSAPLGDSGPDKRRIEGRLGCPFFEAAWIEAELDLSSGRWSGQAQVTGCDVSPQALAAVPETVSAGLQFAKALHGKANLRVQGQGSTSDLAACRFSMLGSYAGRVEDPRLPRPLTDVQATFACDPQTLHIRQATARAGEAEMRLWGRFPVRAGRGPTQLRAEIDRLTLGEELAPALPADWRCLWDRLAPSGPVNVRLELGSDGRQWTQDLTVECLGVSLAYCEFPYRLENARGRVRLKDGLLRLENFRAWASGREAKIEGQLLHPGPGCTGWIEFLLDQPIPLEERLVAALKGEYRKIVRSLRAQGMVTVWGRWERTSAHPPVDHTRLEIGLTDGSLNYEAFQYPLYRIRGNLSLTDGHWRFRDLEGYNDSGWVVCNGSWAPQPNGGTLLALDFNAMDVPLEDELRDALRPEVQRIWNSLRPRGTIDQMRIAARYDSLSHNLSVDVTAVKRPARQNVEGRSITIKPAWLPYSWDDVVGELHFRNGGAELANVRARHGSMQVELNGSVQMQPSGSWRLQLSPLTIDRLDTSHEFIAALPPRLGTVLARLNPSGLICASGQLEMAGDGAAPPRARWQLDFDLENGGLDCGLRLENAHGGLSLEGNYDGRNFVGQGGLAIDSLVYKGIQLSHVTGPLYLEDGRVALGEWIPAAARRDPPRPVTAVVWGGTLAGSARIALQENTWFEIEGELVDADLATISREATMRKHNVSGRTSAGIRLSGSSEGTHTLRGQGRVQLREADIYQLPLMVRLLKLLTIKPPDRTAFTSSDVDFRVEGDRIYFTRIDFEGDAISLDGHGEMNLQREIQLTFGTVVGRDDYYASLLRPILKEAGRRLMVIQVSGTIDDPQVRRELVPQLNERFEQMFPTAPRLREPAIIQESTVRRLFPRITQGTRVE